MKFGFDWPRGFWEEDIRRVWTTDNDACLYYKLTHEPKGSGEQINYVSEFSAQVNRNVNMIKNDEATPWMYLVDLKLGDS